ncbi:MAG: amidohydrolase family protein [Chloroflexota bacterium]
MRIIDAHNHPDWHGHNLQKFLQNMATYNIERTWLLSWESLPDEYAPDPYFKVSLTQDGYPIPFSNCLRYKQAAPEKFTLCYGPDPRRPEAIDQLEAAIELHGVQVYGELKLRMMYDNPDALRMYRYCGEKKLPVVVHIDYPLETGQRYPRPTWWYGGGIAPFERAVQACPETIFIGHAPGFWAHISGDDLYDKVAYPSGPVLPDGKLLQMFRDYPNLYADLSAGSALRALSRDREFSKDFLIEFQDRLLYGRDCFDNRCQELLNGLDLSETVLQKIYADNALRLAPTQY